MTKNEKIRLVLEDGSLFEGRAFGSRKPVSGEVVFNTGMVGYPETLTDPSYKGQILGLTYPLVGNYGVPGDSRKLGLAEHFESDRIQVQGLVVSEYSMNRSHWNSTRTLDTWLKEQQIPGIYGIDTRRLTKVLRERGVLLGKIVAEGEDLEFQDPNQKALVEQVSIKAPIHHESSGPRIVLVDCGAKNNIVRSLLDRRVDLLRVPFDHDFTKDQVDGVLISNGPGNPTLCEQTIANVRRGLEKGIPTFGICLGNQILALAAGGDTYKLKYGHRSQNQPCVEVGTKRCYITSQNHGYAVDARTLPLGWEPWFINANDGTNEGIRHRSEPFMSVQFHPEAAPGPTDADYLFDHFLRRLS